jgi:hypothetical protein
MTIPKIYAEKAIRQANDNDLKSAVLSLAEGLWILSGIVKRSSEPQTSSNEQPESCPEIVDVANP